MAQRFLGVHRNEDSANVDGSEIVFVYDTSVPDAINGNTNQYSDDFAASGFLYSTAEVTYPAKTNGKSTNDRRILTKRDIWVCSIDQLT